MATLLVLLILAVCLEACTANTTSSGSKALECSAGNFTAGDNATVTCYFPTDVSATMHHVYVTWYPFNNTDVYKDVITCFRRRNGLLKCDVLDGYKYNNVISDTLIFEIPAVTPHFAGRYSCLLVPPWGSPPDLCTLHVKTEIPRGNSAKASCSPQTDRLVIILIVLIVLLAVLLGAVVLGVFFKFIRKKAPNPPQPGIPVEPQESVVFTMFGISQDSVEPQESVPLMAPNRPQPTDPRTFASVRATFF